MADLGILALGTYANLSSTTITGSDPVLEVIASADDADYASDATNSTHTGSASFAMGDTPADLASMTTLAVRLRYHWATGTQVNAWSSLRARVFKSDGSTPLTDEATVASSITTTSATNSSVIAFTGVDTAATKAEWDAALVVVYWFITKVKGGDTVQKRVTAGEMTGTYSGAVSDSTSPATVNAVAAVPAVTATGGGSVSPVTVNTVAAVPQATASSPDGA